MKYATVIERAEALLNTEEPDLQNTKWIADGSSFRNTLRKAKRGSASALKRLTRRVNNIYKAHGLSC